MQIRRHRPGTLHVDTQTSESRYSGNHGGNECTGMADTADITLRPPWIPQLVCRNRIADLPETGKRFFRQHAPGNEFPAAFVTGAGNVGGLFRRHATGAFGQLCDQCSNARDMGKDSLQEVDDSALSSAVGSDSESYTTGQSATENAAVLANWHDICV